VDERVGVGAEGALAAIEERGTAVGLVEASEKVSEVSTVEGSTTEEVTPEGAAEPATEDTAEEAAEEAGGAAEDACEVA
jgi:hypothetical protein